jgi:Ankyrin repeats (3 copies)
MYNKANSNATNSEKFKLVQKLIEYNANFYARDWDGWTPLNRASRGEHLKDGSVLRLLLERGADVNARADDDGFTPLHRASAHGTLKVVRLLLEYGADVEAINGDGETALQVVGRMIYRMDQGRLDEIRRLLMEHKMNRKHLVVFSTCLISGPMEISYFFSSICCKTMCQYTNTYMSILLRTQL